MLLQTFYKRDTYTKWVKTWTNSSAFGGIITPQTLLMCSAVFCKEKLWQMSLWLAQATRSGRTKSCCLPAVRTLRPFSYKTPTPTPSSSSRMSTLWRWKRCSSSCTRVNKIIDLYLIQKFSILIFLNFFCHNLVLTNYCVVILVVNNAVLYSRRGQRQSKCVATFPEDSRGPKNPRIDWRHGRKP